MSRTVCNLNGEGFSVPVIEDADGRVSFTADADIDADGAPHAYHPAGKGLDDLSNAKDRRGNWVGVLAIGGVPLIQKLDDLAPGYYISTTTYEHGDKPRMTQRRFLNAEVVPFIVVSPLIVRDVKGIVLGCHARVTFHGVTIDAVVGDIGPLRKAGEVSIAAARMLGIPSSPRTGGEDRPIVKYELFPGTPAQVLGVTYTLQPA